MQQTTVLLELTFLPLTTAFSPVPPVAEPVFTTEPPVIEAPMIVGEPELIKHTVKPGDTLSGIAKEYHTTWRRIWNRNKTIHHPDIIFDGQVLVIPEKGEKLKSRPLPRPKPQVSSSSDIAYKPFRGSVGGNSYTPGQCTYYAKMRRPDLPNTLGNADTWYYRARDMGLPTGTTPRVGAIGMFKTYMHVAYVEAISGSQVKISEWNNVGPYIKTIRWVDASAMLYIYNVK